MPYRVCDDDPCCLEAETEPDACAETDCGPVSSCSQARVCGCGAETAPVDCDQYPLFFQRVARRARGEEERAGRDRRAADGLYDEIMGMSAVERTRVVEGHPRFVSFALAERLLAASREVLPAHPEASQELARLALGVTERLDSDRYGRGLVADLKARSWAYLGHAWSHSAPTAAREAFRLARSLLGRGSGDPLEEAEVLSLAAGEYPPADEAAAIEELGRVEGLYRSVGDPRRLAETLLRKARLVARRDGPSVAAGLLREAAQVLGESAEPDLLAEVGAETALQLEAAGRPDEAWIELGRVRRLAGTRVGPELALRLRWIEGRVAAVLGLGDDARGHLQAARDGLLAAGRPREAVAAQLDLAALEAREDGPVYDRAMERLKNDLDRLVLAAELPREHVTALALLGQAAARRALVPDLVRAVGGFLERVG